MRTLNECKPKETITVVRLHGSGALKRRIMDMGITKGVEIHVPNPQKTGGQKKPGQQILFLILFLYTVFPAALLSPIPPGTVPFCPPYPVPHPAH